MTSRIINVTYQFLNLFITEIDFHTIRCLTNVGKILSDTSSQSTQCLLRYVNSPINVHAVYYRRKFTVIFLVLALFKSVRL